MERNDRPNAKKCKEGLTVDPQGYSLRKKIEAQRNNRQQYPEPH